MAEGKKSFVLYADLIKTFEHLNTEQKGEVIWWVLEYVNDLNPEPLNGLLAAVVEPIKQQLKRDLKKYEQRANRSRENGKKGGRPKNLENPVGYLGNPEEPKKPDSDNDSGNDSGNDSVSGINTKQLLTKSDFDFILKEINSIFSRKFKVISEATKGKYKARIREGFTVDDIINSMKVVFNDKFHRENNFKYITPDYFSRYKTLTMHSEELVKVSGTDKLTEKAKKQIELYGNTK